MSKTVEPLTTEEAKLRAYIMRAPAIVTVTRPLKKMCMIDDTTTTYIGSYITVRPSTVLEWLLLPFRLVWLCYVVLGRDRHWLLDPHPGESCAPKCYRLIVEVNRRRLLAWRH